MGMLQCARGVLAVKKRTSTGSLNGAEEAFFEEQLQREYRRLKETS